MNDLREIEDLLDLCMARSDGVLSHDMWQELAALKGSVRMRRGFVGEILAVALAGATGSGKSSILNALCGENLAEVGVRRPTTSRSLAALPSGTFADLQAFVDLLGVDDVVSVESLSDIAIVDLPDMDSRVVNHRAVVEAALRVVDAVVWVLDPEKYADIVIHREFLAPLRQYSDQFIFCLNKVDRLGADVEAVMKSLRGHLVADGYEIPAVVTTVAVSDQGSTVRIEQLAGALEERLDRKRTAQMTIALNVSRFAARAWHSLDEVFETMRGSDRDASAVAMASFVSLGIAAYGLHHDLSEAAGG